MGRTAAKRVTLSPYSKVTDLCLCGVFMFSVCWQRSPFHINAFGERFYPKGLKVHSGFTFYQDVLCLGTKPSGLGIDSSMLCIWTTGIFSHFSLKSKDMQVSWTGDSKVWLSERLFTIWWTDCFRVFLWLWPMMG